ncbi:MAG: hypothetical protein QOD27_1811 [Microbacteriaceae bacterium]|nr:hypothetical protein [Microbacteriaceae bacterium]
MTSATLLSLMARRWWVILIGLLLTAGAYAALQQNEGAFSTDATVIFVAPGDRGVGEVSDGYLGSLVDFAAVIERDFHDGRQSDRLAENASLYGAGVTQGYRVLLVNSGSQWENSFAKPALAINIVGPSEDWVVSTLDTVTARIASLAAARQAQLGVDSAHTITTERVPDAAVVSHVGSSRGTKARAMVALTVVGLGLSVAAAVGLDRAIARSSRRSRRTRTNTRPAPSRPPMIRQKEGSTP